MSRVTLQSRTAQAVTYHPFDAKAKYRQHTEQASNVTAQPTIDKLRSHESRPHCHDTALRYAVTLHVCTHLKSSCSAFEKTTELLALDLSAHTRTSLFYERTISSDIYLHCY